MRWDWLPDYLGRFGEGIIVTLELLGLSIAIGMAFAIPLGLVQVTGPRWLAVPARMFCTAIRGTPLLIQLWLLYYGVGSLFPMLPGIRESFLWPILRDAFPYAVLAFSLSVAGYEGEVMRGAFRGARRANWRRRARSAWDASRCSGASGCRARCRTCCRRLPASSC